VRNRKRTPREARHSRQSQQEDTMNMPYKFPMYTTLALSVAFALQVQAQQPTSAPKQPGENPDAMFVQKAGEGGMAEVELSRLAEKSASSPEVRRFATHMVQDHSANNKELLTIAAHENISPPKDLDSEHAAIRDKLAAMKGTEFDRAYLDAMRNDHRKMDDLLKSSQATVSTEELRTYIKKTTPVVEAHLRMAQNLKE
jgi:putative membrane protein